MALFCVSGCVLKLSKGFCCVSSINRLFVPSSSPLEIILGQAVPAQDLFIGEFVLPPLSIRTPCPAPAARGAFPPQPMKSGWQHLPRCCNPGHHLPRQPKGAAAPSQGSFSAPCAGHAITPGLRPWPPLRAPAGQGQELSPPPFASVWGSLGRRTG